MKQYQEIQKLVASLEEEVNKFYNKDNKAAGTRIRKGMQELKKLAQEIREDVQRRKEQTMNTLN